MRILPLQNKVVRGVGVLVVGQVLCQAMSFARNIVIARLISPDDYGIAITFVIAINLLEMTSDLSVDRLLVQAKDGDDPEFQATAQSFQLLRGLILSIIMFLLAWPMSRLFGIPQALWGFQVIAIVPLVRGLSHLDPKRLHREMNYSRDVIVEFVTQAAMLLAAIPLASWLRNYSMMVWLLLAQVSTTVLVSHAVAKSRYRLQWNRAFAGRMIQFGWPLAINGLLMFGIFQGDRMIIGSTRGPSELAVYSIALSLTMIPVLAVAKVNASILLPCLAQRRDDTIEFANALRKSTGVLTMVAAASR